MKHHNPDLLADDHSLSQVRQDMEDDIIKDAFFDFTKGKRNWRAVCLTDSDSSDKKMINSLDGSRLPIKLRVLDTLDSVLPNPCALKFSEPEVKKIVSLYPTGWSTQPFENRYSLPSFGHVLRVSFNEKGPAEQGRHRGLQYTYKTDKETERYDCETRKFMGGLTSFTGRNARLLRSVAPGAAGPHGAIGPPLGAASWDDTVGAGETHWSNEDTKNNYMDSNHSNRNSYDDLIVKWSSQYNIDPNLVKALIWAESGFKIKAQSNKGASGLTQIMPDTQESINKVLKYKTINLGDPDQAVHFGVYYLVRKINQVAEKNYVDKYKDVENVNAGGKGYSALELGLISYNSGRGNLVKYGPKTVMGERWDCKNNACGQTRKYVRKVTAWYEWLLANEKL